MVNIKGGYLDIPGITGSIGTINITFTRRLDTGDIYDKPIIPGKKIDFNWAYLIDGGAFDEHSDFCKFYVDFGEISFGKTQRDTSFIKVGNDAPDMYSHGALMTII